jgi:CubicO group peptidase (beta-lactamase class C family)
MAAAWDGLVEEAAKRDSDQLAAAFADGRVEAWAATGTSHPVECMSITKFVVGAILGLAVEAEDLDAPLATWIEEWRDDQRGRLTLRHVVTHTTWLRVLPSSDVYRAASVEALVLALEPVAWPGTFAYSNAAIHLLGVVVKRAAGRDVAELAGERLFDPLGVEQWGWQRDAAGFPLCMAGLRLSARDLAQVGALYLTEGRHAGRQVLPAPWVRATAPVPPGDVGLCCFTDYEWVRRTADRVEVGPRTGFGHTGDFGQHLSIQPEVGVVGVRTRTTYEQDDEALWLGFAGDVRRSLAGG